ncbi:PAS domain-containing protein [Lacinutrix neustonica]|uniref:PAS domain-containing protein n=1 Tax=Lacinutrix neustonica TaxID=2980107 RepID=A0A9E8SES7_9FLAO|nr:PAS domain-containing protein [Lacinutrix neustonica]WAC02629.1 PAS domain-containing protein [Lacinutrix neustonica]
MKNTPLRAPLKSWDLYALYLQRQAEAFTTNTEIEILNEFKEKFNWSFDVEKALKENTFEAIVLTNIDQEIQWVNKGFVQMTGYAANYSKGKRPKFLQGENSSIAALKVIRDNIKKELHFKERVINYRKNGQEYVCDIEIFPLKNEAGKVSHLLALENEVYN